jgi:hypothetical protein
VRQEQDIRMPLKWGSFHGLGKDVKNCKGVVGSEHTYKGYTAD